MSAMIIRALDAQGEWTFGRGKNDYLQFNAAIGQNILSRLRSFLGDCYFDTSSGIDWFTFLGGKNSIGLQLAINAVILNSEGVTGVLLLSLNINSARNISVSYDATTIYTGLLGPDGTLSFTGNFLLTQDGVIITTEDGTPISVS